MRDLRQTGRTVRGQARRRWSLVAALIVVLTAIPVVLAHRPVPATAVAAGTLRDRITASAVRPFHGYAQSAGSLGLPRLPGLDRVTDVLSGTTEMRVWYAAPDRWRVDVLGPGTERDLYRTPEGQVAWDYGDNQLTEIVGEQPVHLPRPADVTPPELARRLLSLATGDRIEALPSRRVAGTVAAGLRIVPAAAGATIAHADIWADPETGLPVRVEVTARGARRPVFVTRFLEVTLAEPPAAVLVPPARSPGTGFTSTAAADVVSSLARWDSTTLPPRLAGQPRSPDSGVVTAFGAYGTGLARFVVAGLPGRLGRDVYGDAARWGSRLNVPGADAVLIAANPLHILVVRADRTWFVAGFVDPPMLTRVAAELAGVAA
ncbi:hypothetical protein AB0J80_21310 [Actinoplanes sp. NPDC049548]|uniref:hypothetical protein n=1 Tax=Actinoplanes sp. NPDC049548 TaxID=3155152 RepID=UPI003414BC7F